MSAHTADRLTTAQWHLDHTQLCNQRDSAARACAASVLAIARSASNCEAEAAAKSAGTFAVQYETACELLEKHAAARPHGLIGVA